MKTRIDIIHEDDAFVVVGKPARFLSIPDRYAKDLPNLYNFLQKKYGEIYIVHRIDRETSGLLVFARTQEAHRHLSQQFEQRTVDKVYLALLDGRMPQEDGVIDKAIAKHPTQSGKMVIAKKGKPSETHYKVIDRFQHFTLVEANIKTGRTHQIRVHFESIGYPLAIDEVYGRRPAFLLSEVKGKKYNLAKDTEERPLMSRSALHAHRLSFDHPDTGERLSFEAPLPKDFAAVVKQLGKWDRIEG